LRRPPRVSPQAHLEERLVPSRRCYEAAGTLSSSPGQLSNSVSRGTWRDGANDGVMQALELAAVTESSPPELGSTEHEWQFTHGKPSCHPNCTCRFTYASVCNQVAHRCWANGHIMHGNPAIHLRPPGLPTNPSKGPLSGCLTGNQPYPDDSMRVQSI
jgi:hypothetical protein